MRQLQITATKPEHTFAFAEVDRPVPGKRQLLVEVAATGVNPADWKWAGGENAPLPHPIGLDVAGAVVEVGSEVVGFAVGDRVVGQAPMRSGTFAPLAVVRAKSAALVPDNVDFADAATLVTSGQAAYAAIIEEGGVSAGQAVLIHGAGGAVGTFAVQIARHAGARVIATASARHHGLLRDLGVDEIIDYTTTCFDDVVRDVDVVLDTIGGDTFLRSIDVLRDGGTMVSIAFFDDPPSERIERKHLQVRQLSMRPDRTRLETLVSMTSKGALRPVIGHRSSLTEAADAIHRSMNGHNQGNIVVTVP